jgi:hypothetical protein
LHDHNRDRDPKSFSDPEKFIAAAQACHAQNTPLIRSADAVLVTSHSVRSLI